MFVKGHATTAKLPSDIKSIKMVDQYDILLLFVAFACSVLVACHALWSLVHRPVRIEASWIERFALGAFVIAACIFVYETLGETFVLHGGFTRVLLGGGTLLGLLAVAVLGWQTYLWKPSRGRAIFASQVLSICLSVFMAAWAFYRFDLLNRHTTDFGLEASIGDLQDAQDFWAETDDGKRVTLYRCCTDDQLFEAFASQFGLKFSRFDSSLITTADADRGSNCHGWVFTDGRFLLRGDDVVHILEDNGYSEVSEPQPNDILIYRDLTGYISHTALVQAVLKDGTVLLESKWGVDRRVIHRPEDQPYSMDFTYYRTSRPTHVITIKERREDPSHPRLAQALHR